MSYQSDIYLAKDDEIDPKKSVIAEYKVKGTESFERMAKETAAESSVGTWTSISYLDDDIMSALAAKAFALDEKNHMMKVAYPVELFEKGNIPQFMSLVLGNILGMSVVDSMRVVDIHFPDSFLNDFKGPAFGIHGIHKLLGIPKDDPRAILGTIIKPKLGLNPKQHADAAYMAWKGGVDFVKDDEPQTDQDFCRFEPRVLETLAKVDQIETETGRKVLYSPNITAPLPEMEKRARFVQESGGNMLMIDVL
ncbi:MAG: RuBisCO large subunit C-terminal-like domain-containing protein, partial [Candidatus Kariarchaeaceae archaeon]